MIRAYIFTSALAIIAIGLIGNSQLDKASAPPFLLGALTLGGGLVICGLFSIKMLWHGMIGAAVLALLGFGRGILNLSDAAEYLVGQRTRGPAPILELASTLVCGFLLIRILGAWRKHQSQKLLKN
jgi:hypothetical protein